MNKTPSFSERYGHQIQPKPITIRYGAPSFLRTGVLAIAHRAGFTPDGLRSVICSVLSELPNRGQNFSGPNILEECKGLIQKCQWFEVYDFCEALAKMKSTRQEQVLSFEKDLNSFFSKKG